jgi:hypothetical protein
MIHKFDNQIRPVILDDDHCSDACPYNTTCDCCGNHICVGIWIFKNDSIGHSRSVKCKEYWKMKKAKNRNLIEASKIKAGMVIGITIKEPFDDIVLVIAKTGHTKIDYTYLDFQDSYGGAYCGTLDGKKIVKVFKGKRRKQILNHIKDDVFQNLHDIEHLIDVIRLIEDMEPVRKERKKK